MRVAITVRTADPLCPSYVPVIITVPAATAVTVPEYDTVATSELLDPQLGVTVAVVPSLYVAVALTVVVAPANSDADEALTDRLDTVAVGTTTVIVGDVDYPGWPPQLIIVAVPINRMLPEKTPRGLAINAGDYWLGNLQLLFQRPQRRLYVFSLSRSGFSNQARLELCHGWGRGASDTQRVHKILTGGRDPQ